MMEEEKVVEVGSWVLTRVLPVGVLVFCLYMVLKVVDFLWWRPKRLQKHFAKQGISGPPYRFFLGNVKEMVGLMDACSNKILHQYSHNILPRVLAFYPHWKKIYGMFI